MNRPSRVEESTAWRSLLPWLQWIDPWKCNNSPTLMIRSAFPDILLPSWIEGHCVPSTQDAFHYQSYSWTLMTSRCSCDIESGAQWKWNEDWKPFVRIRPQASLFVLTMSIPCMWAICISERKSYDNSILEWLQALVKPKRREVRISM